MNSATLLLAPKLDLREVGTLRDQLLEHRGNDLVLDAKELNQIGALSVQVLRSAAKTWQADGKSLSFQNASNDCDDQLKLLGFSAETICQWEAA